MKSQRIRIEKCENGLIVTTQAMPEKDYKATRYVFSTHRELVTFFMAYLAGLEEEDRQCLEASLR